jgi:hypothetical protein
MTLADLKLRLRDAGISVTDSQLRFAINTKIETPSRDAGGRWRFEDRHVKQLKRYFDAKRLLREAVCQ